MKKAIGYIRVSTEEQAREGVSIEAQKAKIQAYASLQDFKLTDLLIDAGVSASKAIHIRPAGSRMAEMMEGKNCGVDTITAIKLDRLFRNAAECLIRTEQWEKKGIALHLIDQGGASIDTTSSMGRFFLTIMAGVAEMERNMIRERTRTALEYKRNAGEKTGGNIPMGYDVIEDGSGKKRLIKNDTQQNGIKIVKRLSARGMSTREIAREMERRNIPTASGKMKWYPTTVKRIIEA